MTTRVASPSLVGRSDQLAALHEALRVADAGRPTAVLVAGEAGVGKSRLVEEFVTAAASGGARVLVGRCVELGEDGLPFAPVVGALRSLLAETGAQALAEAAGPGREALARLLPEVGPVGPDSPAGRGRLFEVVATLLERLAADRSVVLVLEDLHWADASTRDLLRFLVRVLTGTRLLIVVTYRSDEMRRGHPLRPLLAELERVREVDRVEVPRLSHEQVAAQLAGILEVAPSAAVVEDVYRRSEGIPFFVEELACCSDGPSGWLPDSLREVLLVRAEQLPPGAYGVLRLAAVGGSRVEHGLLAAVAELPDVELEAHLRDAVAGHVLVVDGTGYAFRHALLREVLHDDLLPGEHARLHVRYARALEAQPELMGGRPVWATVAHHWHSAHDAERAFHASLRAAEDAGAAYAHAEAQRMLERAVELWGQVEDPAGVAGIDRPELLRRASTAARDAGNPDRALALVESALAEFPPDGEPARRARLLERRGRLLFHLGRPDEAVEVLESAVRVVGPDGPPLDRGAAQQVLAAILMLRWRFEEAAARAEEAIALARVVRASGAAGPASAEDSAGQLCEGDGSRLHPDFVEAAALNTLGVSLVALGRTEDGLAALERGRELAAAGGHEASLDRYYVNASDSLMQLGRDTEAVAVAREGMDVATRRGLTRTTWAFLAGNAAEPLLMLGEWDEASGLIERALALDPPPNHLVNLRRLRAWLLLWRGDLDTAGSELAALESDLARRDPGPQYVVAVAHLAAEVALARGRPEQALDTALRCLDEQPVLPALHWPLVAAAARAASLVEEGGAAAAAARERLRAVASELDWWPTAAFWRPVFDAEDSADDPDRWRSAAAAVQGHGGPAHLLGRCHLRAATALAARGERGPAAEELRRADAVAERLDAAQLADEIEQLARRARLVSGLDDGRAAPAPTHGLTPREREVLDLVAAGRSNRQIGEALFISTKTASVHVSNILSKLGVHGRGEAAALAHREGLVGDRLQAV